MADSSVVSFRLDDQLITDVEDASQRNDVPKSEVYRELLMAGAEALASDDADASIDLPDHVGHDAEVRRMIQRNKATRRSGKFRSEFNEQLKQSFSGNECETPSEFRQSVAGYIEEAEDLGDLPDDVAAAIEDEHGERFETYAEWVDWMVEEYYPAHYRAQQFDGQHISDPLGSLSGIENATEWVDRAEEIAAVDSKVQRQKRASSLLQSDTTLPDHVEDAIDADPKPRPVALAALCQSEFGDADDTGPKSLENDRDSAGDDDPALDD